MSSGITISNVHPKIRSKEVFKIDCKYCDSRICTRAMEAMLLTDANVLLYSTDIPPTDKIGFTDKVYVTKNCTCLIRDIACLMCGNPVGYCIVCPCSTCLQACNNGHLYMFTNQDVVACNFMQDKKVVTWGQLLTGGVVKDESKYLR